MSPFAAMRKLWQSIAPRTPVDVEQEFFVTFDAYQEDLGAQKVCREKGNHQTESG